VVGDLEEVYVLIKGKGVLQVFAVEERGILKEVFDSRHIQRWVIPFQKIQYQLLKMILNESQLFGF